MSSSEHDYANDADSQSVSDVYSPTDGYFQSRDHPQDLFTQSPNYQNSDAAGSTSGPSASKSQEVQEAQEDRETVSPSTRPQVPSPPVLQASIASQAYTPSPTDLQSYSSSRPRVSPAFSDENTPLLYAEMPPPTYSYAPPVDHYHDAARGRSSYGERYSDDADERQAFLFGRRDEPEDMGGLRAGSVSMDEGEALIDPEKARLETRRRRARRWCSSRRGCQWIWGVIALFMIVWVLVGAFAPVPNHPKQLPITDPVSAIEPPQWPTQCSLSTYSSENSFTFGKPSSFTLKELISGRDDNPSHNMGVYGTIHLYPAPHDQEKPIFVNITTLSTLPFDIDDSYAVKSKIELNLMTPKLQDLDDWTLEGSRPCLIVTAYVFIRPDVKLSELNISTHHLGVTINENLHAEMEDTNINLLSGSLYASPFKSRRTHVSLNSGSISGVYSLYDLLSLRTKSGSINVDIEPKEANDEDVQPAELLVRSYVGSIKVDTDTLHLPERDYRTQIVSHHGSVSGSFLHGSRTKIESSSGAISGNITPFAADDYVSNLIVTSKAGRQDLIIEAPYKDPRAKMGRMTSYHSSSAGSLTLRYPQEWEGEIRGSTKVGSLKVRGKDVDIDGDGGPVGHKVHGTKGDGNSKLGFEALSGSVDLVIGDL